MKAIWSGAIRFGLIEIPIKLYRASEKDELDLHLITREDMARIRYRRVHDSTGAEVPLEAIVHGYEYEKGSFIPLEEEDFRRASPRKTRRMEILHFTRREEVEFRYLDKPYALEPDEGGEKAFALLRDAMRETRRLAFVRYVLKTREHLGLLEPSGRGITLIQMRFASELLPLNMDLPRKDLGSGKEIRMATKLVDLMSAPWKPDRYHDTYIEDVKRYVERKIEGKPVTEDLEEDTVIIDLLEGLRASLADQETSNRRK